MAGNASGKASSCHTILCATRQLFWGLSHCWEQITLPELLFRTPGTRTNKKKNPPICISKKVARDPANYQVEDPLCAILLHLWWDELVILKWNHECDCPPSHHYSFLPSPWIWVVSHWVHFLYLHLKTGWLLIMLLLNLCNHTKLASTAMACSPSSSVSKVHRISKPSMNVFVGFFFFLPLHRKLNTKIASKESKRVVKQKILKK